ncbi:hypothetical protein CROQUDRAFT_52502 [Cronartium quercuum f. sp. fusiforme G11]|uniref:TauD/TfdA-like domain-containing protein n=1 Tax=Cronartium quercuum f. sp. fusiforme G11 TaxID=708437 RepID=A0A9P6T7Y4_9BASI|nr:hypothetical protein CROQUDRAFT_52502 [Cronartium quercuum f. sp. fusiforme G11]
MQFYRQVKVINHHLSSNVNTRIYADLLLHKSLRISYLNLNQNHLSTFQHFNKKSKSDQQIIYSILNNPVSNKCNQKKNIQIEEIIDPKLIHQISIQHDLKEKLLIINSKKFNINNLKFSYLWLRDSCESDSSIDKFTKQKLFKSSDIPLNIYPIKSELLLNDQIELRLTWSHHLLSNQTKKDEPDISLFKLSFLLNHSNITNYQNHQNKQNLLDPKLWIDYQKEEEEEEEGNRIVKLKNQDELFINFNQLINNHDKQKNRYEILKQLNQDGIIFFNDLKDVNHENQTSINYLNQLIEYLGLDTRSTFYGNYWDVKFEGKDAKNVANTNLPLDLHMDLLHFQNPPRFQFLYCLKNQVKGGKSSFVDGYSTLKALFFKNPKHFKILNENLISFKYKNANHFTFYQHPTIELKTNIKFKDLTNHNLIQSINSLNYSPPFQSNFGYNLDNSRNDDHIRNQIDLFNALTTFDQLLHQPKYSFELLLEPGQCVAFDNRRILHARTAFENDDHDLNSLGVKRWLRGCYVDGDSVWDRIRFLSESFEEKEI